MNLRLASFEFGGTKVSLLANNSYLIGRGSSSEAALCRENVLLIDHEDLDTKHALIDTTSEGLYIYDLYTSKGTFVNDERLESLTRVKLEGEHIISVRFGNFEANINIISKYVHHDSSGYGESHKSSTFLETSSPIETAKNRGMLRDDVFLKPNSEQISPRIDNNDTSKSIVVPDTPPVNSSEKHEHPKASIFDETFGDMSKDSNDSCIPETQDVFSTSIQAKKINTIDCDANKFTKGDNKENIPEIETMFKMSTQEFDEQFSMESNCSDLLGGPDGLLNIVENIPLPGVETILKSNERSIQAPDVSKTSERSETMRLNWSETNSSQNNQSCELSGAENSHENACTPDLFELLEDANPNNLAPSLDKGLEVFLNGNLQNNEEVKECGTVSSTSENVPNANQEQEKESPSNDDADADLEATQIYIPKKAGFIAPEGFRPPKNTFAPIIESEDVGETQIYEPKASVFAVKPQESIDTRKATITTGDETSSFFNEAEKTSVERKCDGPSSMKKSELLETPRNRGKGSSMEIELSQESADDIMNLTPAFLKKYFANDVGVIKPNKSKGGMFEPDDDDSDEGGKIDSVVLEELLSGAKKKPSNDFDQLVSNINKINQGEESSKEDDDEIEDFGTKRRQNYDLCFGDTKKKDETNKKRKNNPKKDYNEAEVSEKPTTSKQAKSREISRQKKTTENKDYNEADVSEKPTTSKQAKSRERSRQKKTTEKKDENQNSATVSAKRVTRASSKTHSDKRATSVETKNENAVQSHEKTSNKSSRKRNLTSDPKSDTKPAKQSRQTVTQTTDKSEIHNPIPKSEEAKKPGEEAEKLQKPSTSSSRKTRKRSESTTSSSQTSDIDDNMKRLRSIYTDPEVSHSSKMQATTSHANIKIAFTMVSEKMQKKIMNESSYNLWSYANDPRECDVLIMDQGNRTFKFLLAIAKGIPIVTSDWLTHYRETKDMKSVETFYFRDKNFEWRHNFTLPVSLAKAKTHKLFSGRAFFLTPNIVPNREETKVLLQAAGGKCCEETDDEALSEVDGANIYLITNEGDRKHWHKYRRAHKNLRIITTEGVMSAIMTQKIEMLDRFIIKK